MQIVFFSHYYPPEVNAPASRTSEHCREWVRMGHDVTVVTSAPNHPKGELYPGYSNRLFQIEVIDGVKVVRVWTYLAANEAFLGRTLNYVSYADGDHGRAPPAQARHIRIDLAAILLRARRHDRRQGTTAAMGAQNLRSMA